MALSPDNDRSYPSRPYLGVSALLVCEGEVVLVERGRPPLAGFWSLPGGAVETGETLAQAITRELAEELGLDCHPSEIGELVEIIRLDEDGKTQRHFVIAVFIAHIPKLDLIAGDDAANARWVSHDQLSSYQLTEGTSDVIQRLLSGQRLSNTRL